MTELSTDRRFHNLTKEQVRTLDQVLTEVIPIHGRGNFPTLEIKPKDIIHVVRDKLTEKHIKVRDVRLNGSTASHVLVKENGTSYKDLDIIFGVELPKQEDFQIIKEVVLGCLLDFLPRGVNKDKITALTMKEAYVQKMVKVFNEHDRWSLISLSNNSGKNVELKFVSSLRRQFEFSVDSFQIILDRMLESYLEAERKQEAQYKNLERRACMVNGDEPSTPQAEEPHPKPSDLAESNQDQPGKQEDMPKMDGGPCHHEEEGTQGGKWPSSMNEVPTEMVDSIEEMEVNHTEPETEVKTESELPAKIKDEEKIAAAMDTEPGTSNRAAMGQVKTFPKSEKLLNTETQKSEDSEAENFVNNPSVPHENTATTDAVVVNTVCEPTFQPCMYPAQKTQDSYTEFPLPPPAKKSYKKSQMVVLKHSSPKPPRKMSKKVTSGTGSLARAPSLNEPQFLATQPLGPAKINPEESIPIPDKVPSLVSSESLIGAPQDKEHQVKKSDEPVVTYMVVPQDDDTQLRKMAKCPQPEEPKSPDWEVQAHNTESEVMELNKNDKDLLTQSSGKDVPSPTCYLPQPPAEVPRPTVTIIERHVQVSEVVVQVPEHPVQLHDSAVQVPEPGIQEPLHTLQRTAFEAQEIQSPAQGPKYDIPAAELVHQVTEFASQATYPTSLASEPVAQVLEPIFEAQESSQSGENNSQDLVADAPDSPAELPDITVVAESMYGDFEQALDHLRYRLIATRNPEEIRGGGLLKYSNLLVREFKPASETEIKTLERYMCSRFFIDFPDVNEQQRKIESYLRNHFIGEEKSKYDYLMTLRRVVNESTVCLMGHERRQTLNMITILALKVLGEQNIIPNTTNVTCYYQPAPYMADHNFSNYYIAHGQPSLIYHPYPLHMHIETGLV